MIKLLNSEGEESRVYKISASDDATTLNYVDDGKEYKLTKATDSTKKEEKEEQPKEDCRVKKDNADFSLFDSDKSIKLKKGTPISWTIPNLHQGIIVVKAKVNNEWIKGEIQLDDTTCNDVEKK